MVTKFARATLQAFASLKIDEQAQRSNGRFIDCSIKSIQPARIKKRTMKYEKQNTHTDA